MARKPKRHRTELSESDSRLLDAMESGQSYEDAAVEFGDEPQKLRRRVIAILDKMSKDELLERYPIVYTTAHGTEGMDMGTDVIKQAGELGMSKAMTDSVRRRIMARQGLNPTEGEVLSEKQIIEELKKKLSLSLQYYDPFSLAAASSKDVMANIDTIIKNIQLLNGKPTSIHSNEDRKKANELILALVQEANRRGITIDGVASIVPEPVAIPKDGV